MIFNFEKLKYENVLDLLSDRSDVKRYSQYKKWSMKDWKLYELDVTNFVCCKLPWKVSVV